MPRRSSDYSHGVTERESEILNRSDAGVAPGKIAAELGLRLPYVNQVIGQYSITITGEIQWRRAAIASDRAFRAASAGGRFA